MKRRGFLQGGAGTGLWVAVGGSALAAGATGKAGAPTAIATWLRIARDGSVTVLSNTSEIGQGTGTAIAQLLANELDLDWRRVRIEMAPIDKAYNHPVWGEVATYGSGGISGQYEALRKAGAQARSMLVAAAAGRWKVAPAECDTDRGRVVRKVDGAAAATLGYGELVAEAAKLPLPADAPLMPKSRWRFIGQAVPRLDVPAKVDGSAVFGIDVKLPGLRVATVMQSPRFGGRLASVDPAPALAVSGVEQVVKLDDAVAVVARHYWAAKKGLAALLPVWDGRDASSANSAEYGAALVAAVREGGEVFVPPQGDAAPLIARHEELMQRAVRRHEAIYTAPFLSHAAMEPMNATAKVGNGRAELWLPTQSPSGMVADVARELSLPPEAVTVHTTLAGGGFGRRVENDFVLQAVRIARAAGVPVKLIWSREEDMRHDYYRPAAAVKLGAGIDAQGLPVAVRLDAAGSSLFKYSRLGTEQARGLKVDPSNLSRHNYRGVPMLLAARTVDAGVPVGYWRAVAHSQNGFASECFIDELAQQAGADPIDYRLKLLRADETREKRVLETVAERSGWRRPAAAGRHRGMALVRANGSVVAHVVELSLAEGKRVKLHRVTTVVDCGVAVNPGSVRAQMEGGIVFALSAAMNGEITVRNGAVEQSNFHDFPLATLAQVPPMDIVIVDSDDKPGGVGEEAVGPLAPAIANALFAANGGQRLRDLPLSKAGYVLV